MQNSDTQFDQWSAKSIDFALMNTLWNDPEADVFRRILTNQGDSHPWTCGYILHDLMIYQAKPYRNMLHL